MQQTLIKLVNVAAMSQSFDVGMGNKLNRCMVREQHARPMQVHKGCVYTA